MVLPSLAGTLATGLEALQVTVGAKPNSSVTLALPSASLPALAAPRRLLPTFCPKATLTLDRFGSLERTFAVAAAIPGLTCSRLKAATEIT